VLGMEPRALSSTTELHSQPSVVLSFLSFFFFFLYGEIDKRYVVQAGLELVILLPQPPKCWDYRHVLL
jgi:hypothetical protein